MRSAFVIVEMVIGFRETRIDKEAGRRVCITLARKIFIQLKKPKFFSLVEQARVVALSIYRGTSSYTLLRENMVVPLLTDVAFPLLLVTCAGFDYFPLVQI